MWFICVGVMDMIPPDLLRTFLVFDETGTFTATARQVGRTQAAVSVQMSRLEEMVGARLFRKEGRRVTMTTAGEQLLLHARRILADYERMRDAFEGMPLVGHIRFGAPDDYAQLVLPKILGDFSECHPSLSLELFCTTNEDLLTRIAGRQLDMALITINDEDEAIGSTVKHGRLIWVGRCDLAIPNTHPIPLAFFPAGCRFRRHALTALEQIGRPYRIAYTSSSLSGIIAAVGAGLAVTILPEQDLDRDLVPLDREFGLPALPDYRLLIWCNDKHPGATLLRTLERHIAESLGFASPGPALSRRVKHTGFAGNFGA